MMKIVQKEFGSDNVELTNLLFSAVNYICETDFIPNYYSTVLGREIKTLEDYITIDKMACDLHNSIWTILNIKASNNKEKKFKPKPCNEPVFFDEYDYKIVEGFKITINDVMPFRVKAFNNKGEVVELEEKHYFPVNTEGGLYFVGKILKMNNIHEIEITCVDRKRGFVVEKFEINKYIGC